MPARLLRLTGWTLPAALLIAATATAGCAVFAPAGPETPGTDVAIRPDAIEAHMRFLADDLLEGREAGTRGYDLAAAYVAAQFRLVGLRPAGDSGSYFQAVDFQAHWLVPEGTRLVVHPAGGRGSVRLRLGEDYLMSSSGTHASSAVRAPAVFVGYGIHAPAFGHDDYEGVDVAGRIAVMLLGAPSSFPSEEAAHYGATKHVTAAARGASGIVLLYTDRYERVFPWQTARSLIGRMSMSWIAGDGVPFDEAPGLQAVSTLGVEAASALFAGAPRSYEAVHAEAEHGAPKGFALAVSLDMAQQSRHERRTSANVAGVLEGSDPTLRQEHVVMVGHLDHEGIGPPVDGDSIYNGAMDNASGIAALLESARALASGPVHPRRSVLFLAVTAEEKGLLGADYFARHPTVPKNSLVAVVNLDMPILLYDFTDIVAFGAEHSTLQRLVASTLADLELTLTPDPWPDEASFTRSDQYAFVRQGIPAVYLYPGVHATSGEGDGGRAVAAFLATHYHQPSDDLRQPIDFAVGARFAHLNVRLLQAIADADSRPAWNEENFFGDLFGAQR